MRKTRVSLQTPRRQAGAVLVLALLVVAAVAILATAFAGQFQLSAARGENRWHGSQAQGFLLGAESLAIAVLEDDRRKSDIDHLGEDWARRMQPFNVEGGLLEAHLEDAQGRFNLNSLAGKIKGGENATDEAGRFTPPQRRFIRLLQTLEEVPLNQFEAIAITEALMDWLDRDDEVTGFGGAESDYYQSLETQYRAANRQFISVTELRLVRYISPQLYTELSPLVVVLPDGSGMNVNTAPLALLRTLQPPDELTPLSQDDAAALVASRDAKQQKKGYGRVSELLDSDTMRDVLPQGASIDEEGLEVSSRYFLLHGRAQVLQQRRALTSLLLREGERVTPIKRTDG